MVWADFSIFMCFVQFFYLHLRVLLNSSMRQNCTAGRLLSVFSQIHLRYCLLQNTFSPNREEKRGTEKAEKRSRDRQHHLTGRQRAKVWFQVQQIIPSLFNCPDVFLGPLMFFVGIKYSSGKEMTKEMLNFS